MGLFASASLARHVSSGLHVAASHGEQQCRSNRAVAMFACRLAALIRSSQSPDEAAVDWDSGDQEERRIPDTLETV